MAVLAERRITPSEGDMTPVSQARPDELRLLEYGQRLAKRCRAVLATESQPSPGQRLYADAARGGAKAVSFETGSIAAGRRADLVVLDPEHPALWNKTCAQVLDAWIFAGDSTCVRDVMVGGAWRIIQRNHPQDAILARRFREAQAELLQ